MKTQATPVHKGWTFPLTLPRVVMLLIALAGIGVLAWRFTVGLARAPTCGTIFPGDCGSAST